MGTRPKIKYKKVTKKQLWLSEAAQRKMALEMFNGLAVRRAAVKYNVSLAYTYCIFNKFVKWEMKWRFR